MIVDSIESLRPKMKLFASLEEANQSVMDLNKEYEDKISKVALFSNVHTFEKKSHYQLIYLTQ